ncbi:MAG: long-chain fatty acid--CoA ligase [Saprospiraceae bacterium]|nr:long-chain fatty acid--CoA ligase [Saprospiraceae bacterium]
MQVLGQDWAAKWADYSPEKIAFKEFESGRTITYRSLHFSGNRLAIWLTQEKGFQKGDRVAVLSEYCLEYIQLFVAAQKTGIILVPLNYRLAAAEIEYQLEITKPVLYVASDAFIDNIQAECKQKYEVVSCDSIAQVANEIEREPDFEPAPLSWNDPIFILFTSGTTGFPKGAQYTYQMLFWNSINTAMSLIINSESRTVNCMPPFHTGGWNVFLTPFLHHGGYSCLMKKFDATQVLRLLEEEEATIFMGVPTILKMLAEEPNFAKADLSKLHYIIVGGEPMPIPLIETWHQKGIFIRQGYGMTEVGPNLTSLHQNDAIRKKGSIGKPNFYVQTKIVDPYGEELGPNEAGELIIKGPMVTSGYWNNEEATNKAIQNGWFHTGDMARRDEEGYLFIVDRIKNMFISGGENVYPAEVERVLMQHEPIKEAVVIGVADAKWGEVGKAFVVLKNNEIEDEEALRAFCKERLAKYKVPKYFEFIAEIPKNDTGKLNRKALKQL